LAFKVIEFGANQEPVYDFLLVINSNLGPSLVLSCSIDVKKRSRKNKKNVKKRGKNKKKRLKTLNKKRWP